MAVAERRGVVRALGALVDSQLFKPAVFAACLAPGALLAHRLYLAFTGADPDALGPDPTKYLEHETGRYALAILLFTLTVTPARRLLGLNRLQGIRRMLGVWAFAYALLHLAVYLVFDQLCYSLESCQFPAIWDDVARRPFIFMGMTAFSILAVLAATSTTGWMRRLGRNWQRLHRLVYVAAVAAAIHFAWGQKAVITEPLQWAAYLAVLLALRLFWMVRRRTVSRPEPAVTR